MLCSWFGAFSGMVFEVNMGLNASIVCLSSVAEGWHLPPLDLGVGEDVRFALGFILRAQQKGRGTRYILQCQK